MKVKSLILLSILFLSFIPFVKADSTQWYDTAFQYRNVYFIDSNLIDDELTDFPVLVYLNSSYVNWTRINNDLSDLRFISSENILFSHEIDSYTVNSEAWLWIKINVISNVIDTKFFMYYGSSIAESVEDKSGVWSNGFVGVWHMNDNSTSTILDSTSNDNDGAKKGANEPIEATGQIGEAQDFDGNDDYIEVLWDSSLNFSDSVDFTVSLWLRTSDTGDIVSSYEGTPLWRLEVQSTQGRFGVNDGSSGAFATTSIGLNDDVMRFISCSFDRDGYIQLFLDGSPNGSPVSMSAIGDIDNGYNVTFGSFGDLAGFLDSSIDEIRISNVARSDAWVKANYNSQTLNLISLNETETYGEESLAVAIIALMIALFSFVLIIISKRNGEK